MQDDLTNDPSHNSLCVATRLSGVPTSREVLPVTLITDLKVLASMGPVEGRGVTVGHPHEALAAQHSLDGALPSPWGLALQSSIGRHRQPS